MLMNTSIFLTEIYVHFKVQKLVLIP